MRARVRARRRTHCESMRAAHETRELAGRRAGGYWTAAADRCLSIVTSIQYCRLGGLELSHSERPPLGCLDAFPLAQPEPRRHGWTRSVTTCNAKAITRRADQQGQGTREAPAAGSQSHEGDCSEKATYVRYEESKHKIITVGGKGSKRNSRQPWNSFYWPPKEVLGTKQGVTRQTGRERVEDRGRVNKK